MKIVIYKICILFPLIYKPELNDSLWDLFRNTGINFKITLNFGSVFLN